MWKICVSFIALNTVSIHVYWLMWTVRNNVSIQSDQNWRYHMNSQTPVWCCEASSKHEEFHSEMLYCFCCFAMKTHFFNGCTAYCTAKVLSFIAKLYGLQRFEGHWSHLCVEYTQVLIMKWMIWFHDWRLSHFGIKLFLASLLLERGFSAVVFFLSKQRNKLKITDL